MEKTPGFYSYIAKKTRDLLYDDHSHNSLKFSPYVPGYAFTSAYKNGKFMSTFSQQGEHGVNFILKLSEDPTENHQFFSTFIVDQSYILPGLKATFSTKIHESRMVGRKYQNAGAGFDKVGRKYQNAWAGFDEMGLRYLVGFDMGLRYLNDWVGFNLNAIGLTRAPVFNFSGLVRDKATALGTDVSFDTKTGLATCSAVISYCYKDLIASLTLNKKGNTLNASYYHKVSSKASKNMNSIQAALASLSVTAVGAEATHKFSTNETAITIGTQFALSDGATLKARANNIGMASVVIESKWNEKTFVTLSGEVDTVAENRTPKFGIAFSTKS